MIERASEPADIYWKNIPTKFINRVWLTMYTYFIMFLILLASFCINLSLGLIRNQIEDINSGQTFSILLYILQQLFSIWGGVITTAVNLILEYSIIWLSSKERHETITSFNLTVGIKIAFAMFFNTGWIPFFVNYSTKDWFTSSGLCVDVFYNLLSVCFLSPLLNIYSFNYLKTKYIIRREKKNGERSLYTQRRMNKLYEGKPYGLANRYASCMLLFMLSAFYVTLIPYVPIICMWGAFYQYWLEKWVFITKTKVPDRMGSYLDVGFRSLFPLVIFIYGLGQFVFIRRLSNHQNKKAFIVMWITFAYMVSPIRWLILDIMWIPKVIRRELDSYKSTNSMFKPDYIDINPVEFENVSFKQSQIL